MSVEVISYSSHWTTIESELNIFLDFFHVHSVHLDFIKVFYLPTDAQVICLKKNNFKIYIKVDIKTVPTCFGVITIIRERTIRSCILIDSVNERNFSKIE
jgi:hypothetical protein